MSSSNAKRSIFGDPLSLIALGILVFGVVLLLYGLVPFQQPKYVAVSGAVGIVPVIDPATGNYIFSPEDYFKTHYNGTLDSVQCTAAGSFYRCFGYQFAGMTVAYSLSSRYYGLAMVSLGLVGVYAARRFAPTEEKPPHLRPIRIRVDEDICVANGVCVAIAPTVFQLKRQEAPTLFAPLAYVVDPLGADNDTIIVAAQMCPTGAIIIEDEETGERIHPPLPKTS